MRSPTVAPFTVMQRLGIRKFLHQPMQHVDISPDLRNQEKLAARNPFCGSHETRRNRSRTPAGINLHTRCTNG